MSKEIITHNKVNETQNFTAIFDRYSAEELPVKICFIDVRDNKENLLKPSWEIIAVEHDKVIGKLVMGEKISFKAQIFRNKDSMEGFEFVNIEFFDKTTF